MPLTVPVIERVTFRRAQIADTAGLSGIAWAAKASWGYPAAWMEAWRPHLTITERTLVEEHVWLAESAAREIVGFFSVRRAGQRWHLEHLWVKPGLMGRGIGRQLVDEARRQAAKLGARKLAITSDPSAEAFYRKLGAKRVGVDRYYLFGTVLRELPLLELTV